MRKRESDPSVHNEPHVRDGVFRRDPTEDKAERVLDKSRRNDCREDAMVERTVWDEPALSPELEAAPGTGGLDYRSWLQKRRAEITVGKSLLITVGIAAIAGPWAIIGTFLGSGENIWSILAIVVFAPVVEEVMKIAAATYVVEKRPFYFRSVAQIALCVLASAAVFSAIENMLYHNVYVPDPPLRLVRWRWTVCLALHMSCSLIAGLGLMRIWKDVWRRMGPPRMHLGFPYMLTAVLLHGSYNAFAIVLSLTKFRF